MQNTQHNDPMQRCGGLLSRLAFERAERQGVNVRDLLRTAGLDFAAIEDPHARLSVIGQIKFVATVAEATGDPELGVHLARDLDLRRMEFLYYVPASADSMGAALRRLERYCMLANDGVVIRVRKGKSVRLAFHYAGVARHIDRHQIEFFITAAIRLCRHLVGRAFKLLAVRIAHRKSSEEADLGRVAGVKIRANASADEIEFPAAYWQLPIATTDPHLHNLLVRYCEEAFSRHEIKTSGLRVRVENIVAPLLPHGQALSTIVAVKLGMSPRTLARRLAAENLSFARVIRELRLLLARRYLEDRELTISQIAWLLGYTETGAFTHAFRRWTGIAPSQARGRSSQTGQ